MEINKYIEALFLRLEVVYGNSFSRQWRDEIIHSVKQNWAETLGKILENPDMLDFAFQNLSPDRPPKTAMEFREIALRAPEKPKMALPPKAADKSRVEAVLATIRRPKAGSGHPKEWAWRMKEQEEHGVRLTEAQRRMWRSALLSSA